MLFSNLKLTGFVDKVGNIDIVGLGFALKILFAYLLGFMLISWGAFTKRDIEV
jgi:ABC-type transport system involved in multi-copper enzyme maturation permease subunit